MIWYRLSLFVGHRLFALSNVLLRLVRRVERLAARLIRWGSVRLVADEIRRLGESASPPKDHRP